MSKQATKTDKSKGKDKKKKDEPEVEEFPELTGTGKFEYPDGTIYIGEYKQLTTGAKIREGKGKLVHPANPDKNNIGEEWYDGEWKDDKMEGYGVYHYSNGDVYEGNWVNNEQNGHGRYSFTDGHTYEGEWKNHRMHGHGKYIAMDGVGWDGEFREGGFHTKDQADLVEEKRIADKIETMKGIPNQFFADWEETFNKSDKKTIKDNLMPFFAKAENMGEYIKETFPKFEEKTPDKWNEAIKFAFGQVVKAPSAKDPNPPKCTININVPKTGEDLWFMNKEGLLTPQIQEELSTGQVIEVLSVLEPRKVSLGLGYNKELGKWLIVYFADITEKAGKK